MASKFFFVGRGFLMPSIPLKLQDELGYDVTYLSVPVDDKGNKILVGDNYENMGLEVIEDMIKIEKLLLSRDHIVVVEDTLITKAVKDRIRLGLPTLNGYSEIEKWETDRDAGMNVCKKIEQWNDSHGNTSYNIRILPQQEFTDFDSAIKFVEENPDRWVIKEGGDSDIRALNYKGELESGMDVIARLEYLKEKGFGGEKNIKFYLQKRVKGIEVAVSAFFNGKEFLNWSEVDFEHQPLLSGDRGPNTGEMVNQAWGLEKDKNPLFKAVYPPIADYLRKVGFHGFINLNGLVDERGYHPFEWTVRAAGSPWVSQLYEMLYGKYDYGEFLTDLALGRNSKIKWNGGFTVGVRVDVPPTIFEGMSYSYLKKEMQDDKSLSGKISQAAKDPDKLEEVLKEYSLAKENSCEMPVIIDNFHPEKARHFHWSDAKNLRIEYKDDVPYGIIEPTKSTLCYITENGEDPKVVDKRLDYIVESMAGLPFITRDDYGECVEDNLAQLEAWGWDVSPQD